MYTYIYVFMSTIEFRETKRKFQNGLAKCVLTVVDISQNIISECNCFRLADDGLASIVGWASAACRLSWDLTLLGVISHRLLCLFVCCVLFVMMMKEHDSLIVKW